VGRPAYDNVEYIDFGYGEESFKDKAGGVPLTTPGAELERINDLTRIAQEQVATSYKNIQREAISFTRAIKQLEQQGRRLSSREKVKLYALRDQYYANLQIAQLQGQAAIVQYLKRAIGKED